MFNRDRALGAYIGAAIGDAMGGPVECSHAERIRRIVGEVTGLLPYEKPMALINIKPGYALQTDAGSVTDDTFIRGDVTRFFLEAQPPLDANKLASWLLANADFSQWWPPAVEALRRVERGEVSAEEGGNSWVQGGGVGWWTPVGILNQGDPVAAAAQVRSLCTIWKAPLERDLDGAVQAGVAEGQREGATAATVIQAMLDACGPLGRALLQRGLDVARQASSKRDLINRLYQTVLEPDDATLVPNEADGPMPPSGTPLPDTDEKYSSVLFAEQIPLAIAAFAYCDGGLDAIPLGCMIGRDADTIATTVGSWVGALHGLDALPKAWVEPVLDVNRGHIDIMGLAESIVDKAEA